MNPKFIKNLKLICKVRRESFELWKKAYSTMPEEIKKNFQKDIAKDAEEYREYRKQLTN